MTEHSSKITQQTGVSARQGTGGLVVKMAENSSSIFTGAGLPFTKALFSRIDNAVEKIKASFGEIDKTIQTIDQIALSRNLLALNIIDEIAFQTNLLASEVTVKAACVKQVSEGFNRVAKEVRDLATHSQQAAQNIATMMEKQGCSVDVTEQITRVLEEIMANFGRTTGLVAKIAVTLQEQIETIQGAAK